MSWQGYVDTTLVGSGHVDKAAIISVAGDSTWAATPGFSVNSAEIKTIIAVLEEKGNAGPASSKVFSEGIHVAGERYVAFNIGLRHIYGRQGDKSGVVIVPTKQAILVAHYNSDTQPGNATQTVEALAKYLSDMDY